MSAGESSWLLRWVQTNDSFFPSGTYSHSFGLEGMVALGLVTDASSLEEFLRQELIPTLTTYELPFVRFAYAATVDRDIERLCSLARSYGAMKGTSELREASLRLGRQRLMTLGQLFPHPLGEELQHRSQTAAFLPHAAIVAGVQNSLGDVPLPAALAGCYYQAIAATIGAAMKLVRLGQVAAQQIMTRCWPLWPGTEREAAQLVPERTGAFTPLLDIASAQHETAHTRIFIS